MIVCIGMWLFFAGLSTTGGLTTQTMKELGFNKIGFYALLTMYINLAIMSWFATPVVNYWGPKKTILFSCFCYILFVAAGLFPAFSYQFPDSEMFIFNEVWIYFIMIFCTGIMGIGSAVFWVALGYYTT